MTRRILVAFLVAAACRADCVAITGSRILGRDLAKANARLSGIPSNLVVGFAPAPGAKRVFTGAELARIAKQNGLAIPNPSEICFELLMQRVGEDDMRAAMLRVLPAGAEIRFAEPPSFNVPAGELQFSPDQIEPPQPGTNGVRLWRGYVSYAERQRLPVWAHVVLTIRVRAIIAARDLPAGEPIAGAALRIGTIEGNPSGPPPAQQILDISGKAPKHAIRAGAAIALADLTAPPDVKAGDTVRVEVQSGLTHLGFDATVEMPARQGDLIELRNPISGKPFKARLESRSRAVVVVGGETGSKGEKP